MHSNTYNESQWHWVADRLSEGYKLYEVADFIGLSGQAIRDNLYLLGRFLLLEDRVPLEERKKEFYALASDGSGLMHNHTVIGTNDKTLEDVRFYNMAAAAKAVGVTPNSISMAIRDGRLCRGYWWRKEDDE